MTSSRAPRSITVLISGSGTNLQALIDAASITPESAPTPTTTSPLEKLPNTKIIRVISDRKDAYGLTRAALANIPTLHHGILLYKKQHPDPSDHPQWDDARRAYDADLAALVLADGPTLVVCAGFMRILTTAFLDPLAAAHVPVINLHPSLHGDLVGAHCIERAWAEFEAGKRTTTGVMVHYVIAEVDAGEPIVQGEVSIEGCKVLGDLQERIHAAEHVLIVKGARMALERVTG